MSDRGCLEELSWATRRMLVALDHYWAAYEKDYDAEQLWWGQFERYRKLVDERLLAPATSGCAASEVQSSVPPSGEAMPATAERRP